MIEAKSTVYIAEDDLSFRKSINRLIRASGIETCSFESAEAFLDQTHIKRPSCLLLDINLPDMDGMELQKELVRRNWPLPVIFITGYGSILMSVQAMKLGAVDFLQKPIESENLLKTIHTALERDRKELEQEYIEFANRNIIGTLTPREYEVLRWVITGLLNKQIASEMGITEKTVKFHRAKVMKKTLVSSVADLVRLAENAGIFPVNEHFG